MPNLGYNANPNACALVLATGGMSVSVQIQQSGANVPVYASNDLLSADALGQPLQLTGDSTTVYLNGAGTYNVTAWDASGRQMSLVNDGAVTVNTSTPTILSLVNPVQKGVATFSGNGSTTAFTITHNLGVVPTQFYWAAQTAAASGAASWAPTSGSTTTQVTLTFGTAPASGTNNVVLNWMASAE